MKHKQGKVETKVNFNEDQGRLNLQKKWDRNFGMQRKIPRPLPNIYSTEIITSRENHL